MLLEAYLVISQSFDEKFKSWRLQTEDRKSINTAEKRQLPILFSTLF